MIDRNNTTKGFGVRLCGLFLIVYWLLAVIQPAARAGSAVVIHLASRVEVNSDTVYLKELATIEAADPELIQHVGNIALGRVFVPGKWRSIKRSYIELKLRQFDVDLSRVRIEGAGEVRVRRAVVEANPEDIRRVVSRFLHTNAPWAEARLKIDAIEITSDTTLPAGPVAYTVAAPKHGPHTGTLPLVVLAQVNGQYEKKIKARVKLSATRQVVRARRPIGRLKPIVAADLELVSLDIGDLPPDPVTDLNSVIGKRARRSIMARSVLQSGQVELPPVVKRGDMVLIVAQTGALRITTVGEVRSSGRPGEAVKVVNVESGKNVVARVVDKSTVKVDF